MLEGIFCKHGWSVLSETTTKSRAEILSACRCTKATGVSDLVGRKFIQVVACKKCGKLKGFVERI